MPQIVFHLDFPTLFYVSIYTVDWLFDGFLIFIPSELYRIIQNALFYFDRKWQNNVAVLDTERWHWRHPTINGSNPAPRSYHSATVVGKLMVVFGGNNQNESFDKVYVLDTGQSNSWLIY